MMTNHTSNQLALLIAAPQPGESAFQNDLVAMTHALRECGIPADRILSLHGQLDRSLVLAFLQTARRQLRGWNEGSLFIHLSGHGFFDGDSVENARPGLSFRHSDEFTDDYHLFWDEFFDVLDLPKNVDLTLLPDLWHANLLVGRVPTNTSALVMKSQPGEELACRGHNFNLPPGHEGLPRGILSYYATQALPSIRSMTEWLDLIKTDSQNHVDTGHLPAHYQPVLEVLGNSTRSVLG